MKVSVAVGSPGIWPKAAYRGRNAQLHDAAPTLTGSPPAAPRWAASAPRLRSPLEVRWARELGWLGGRGHPPPGPPADPAPPTRPDRRGGVTHAPDHVHDPRPDAQPPL